MIKSIDDSVASNDKQAKELTINMRYLWLYVSFLSLNATCVAWTTGGSNQTSTLFAAKFDWSEEETKLYNTMLNCAS